MKSLTITRPPKLDYSGKESLNSICTNISFSGKNIKRIAVTSCTASEGKSTMCARLLLNMADRGLCTVLVDADLRRSCMTSSLGLHLNDDGKMYGLAHYLTGHCAMEDAVYETNVQGAYIVPSGRNLNSPIPLFTSPEFEQMMTDLSKATDVMIIDTPPIGMVVDAAEIVKHCDGIIMVIEYGKRHRREVIDAVEQLKRTGCPILGVVIDKVTVNTFTEKKYYKSHYYYGYYKKDYSTDGKKE